jgi:hypothetical protein
MLFANNKSLENPYLDIITASEEMDYAKLRLEYSSAIPNDDAIVALLNLSPIVELGAGTGYWAWLIQQAGGEVVAIDKSPSSKQWTKVISGNELSLSQYANRTLLLCCPPWDMAYNAIKLCSNKRVIYVGAKKIGTYSVIDDLNHSNEDKFFGLLAKNFNQTNHIVTPQRQGTRDSMWVFERK